MSNELLERLKNFFKNKPVIKAYLFGSVARNQFDENSDVDILVELDYSRSIGLEFVKMQLDLEELLNKKVDLLTNKSISKYIKSFIDEDKILIYEK